MKTAQIKTFTVIKEKKFLLDASILGHMFLMQDKLTKKITKLLKSHQKKTVQLYMLPLTLCEMGNVFRFNLRNDELAEELYEKFLQLNIVISHPSVAILQYALQISFQTKTTFYDALYHATALGKNLVFLTNDTKYYKKAHSLGNILLGKNL